MNTTQDCTTIFYDTIFVSAAQMMADILFVATDIQYLTSNEEFEC